MVCGAIWFQIVLSELVCRGSRGSGALCWRVSPELEMVIVLGGCESPVNFHFFSTTFPDFS
jgi:hypothetical protein